MRASAGSPAGRFCCYFAGMVLGMRRVATLTAAAALGCEPTPATEVMVELHAEPGVIARATTLGVRVLGGEQQVVLERDKTVSPTTDPLARIPLVPRGDDPTRRYTLTAELRDVAGSVLARLEARAGYRDSEFRVLELWFEDACSGKLDCEPGRTCHAGRCLGSCFEPREASASGRSLPTCGECQRCDGECSAADAIPCGCPGEMCAAGACEPAQRVLHAGAGARHTCAVLEDRNVYCWGSTSFEGNLAGQKGRLGTGAAGQDSAVPVLVAGALGRKGIALSGNLTCAIDEQRYCWGLNFRGELGGAPDTVVATPFAVTDPFDLELISSGFRHVCGVSVMSELWCWGYNERGNLGLGNLIDSPSPTRARTGVADASAKGDHTCAVDGSGELYCWGANDSGEIGVPGADTIDAPVRPGCEAQNAQGACFSDWEKVGLGAFHSCAIRSSGELWCWGGNLNGQVGIGPPTSTFQVREPVRVDTDVRFSDVAGGTSFTCGLDEAGALFCWGLNEDRQLGVADADFVGFPTRVDVEAPGGWRELALGEQHACAIRADRTLWCWGRNSDGQIGIGTVTEAPVPQPTRVCF